MAALRSGGNHTVMIPCANPHAQYLAHKDEIDAAISAVLNSGRYILGQEVAAFEKEFGTFLGIEYVLGVGSGTEAIHMALAAGGICRGDEVVTVSHTAVATVAAVELAGATPVLVDIDPETYTMDPRAFEKAITRKTKAVLVVHLYGHPAAMNEICTIAKENKILVIEDCAQAHGARIGGKRVGTFGDIACFSFYPTKNLGALGDGGALATRHAKLHEKSKLLREYGWAERFVSQIPGWNSRLDELQAAVLRIKLRYLDQNNRFRQKIAQQYTEGLAESGLLLPRVRDGFEHVYHLYVARCRKRDEAIQKLKEKGIGAAIHYPLPVHRQSAYLKLSTSKLPQTEKATAEILSLPMYPELTISEIEQVVQMTKEAIA